MSAERDDLLRVGQLAEKTGKTVRAVRFYEELGLLAPVRRSKGGFRLYDPSAIVRIKWIDRLQELSFSLSDIRAFLSEFREQDHGPAAMDHLRSFYAHKLRETQQAIRRLQALERELQESLLYLLSCQSCAPDTPRAACTSCNDPEHQDQPPPTLVAAVHDPR